MTHVVIRNMTHVGIRDMTHVVIRDMTHVVTRDMTQEASGHTVRLFQKTNLQRSWLLSDSSRVPISGR